MLCWSGLLIGSLLLLFLLLLLLLLLLLIIIFIITLRLVTNYELLGERKSLRAQSVGEVSA